jgi:hypothetical protein
MPDPYERHARTKDPSGWENQNPRSARQAAAAEQVLPEVVPEGKRPPAKKDPNLCKGAHWKMPHKPELRIREYGFRKKDGCHWVIGWGRDEPAWWCLHEEVCARCGKVLRITVEREQCPDFHSIATEEQIELDLEIERWRERRAARRLKRPVIDGPQGYRKRKA